MSQSAYDKFARTLKEVGDGGYRFDPTGSNVNVDKSNDSFNVFDLKQQPDGMPVRHTLIDMVDSLMNGRYAVLEYQGKGTTGRLIIGEILFLTGQSMRLQRPAWTCLPTTIRR